MRILYVTNGFPFPLTSGYLRHYFLIRELSARHAISLALDRRWRLRGGHAEALAPVHRAHRRRSLRPTGLVRVCARRSPASMRSAAQERARPRSGSGARLPSWRGSRASTQSSSAASGRFPRFRSSPACRSWSTCATRRRPGFAAASASRHRVASRSCSPEVPGGAPRRAAARGGRPTCCCSPPPVIAAFCSPTFESRGLSPRTMVVPNGVDTDYWQRRRIALGSVRARS